MRIYVASSWRNKHQESMVRALKAGKHDVFDFKDTKGYHLKEADPDWKNWSRELYLSVLKTPEAKKGFSRDLKHLDYAELGVLVLPAGSSAHIEAGYLIGQGKPVIIYMPEQVEPELMYKLAYHICLEEHDVALIIEIIEKERETEG